MNSVNFSKFLSLSLSLSLVLGAAGCIRKGAKGVTPIDNKVQTPPGPGPNAGPMRTTETDGLGPNKTPTSTQIGPDGVAPGDRGDDANFIIDAMMFKQQAVRFDFDSSTVKPSEKPKIDVVATYLKGNPTFKLRIEGHCDERGTDGYNLSLGERRALSVREVLLSMGIASERVTTISYGEEKPEVLGHDEAAWAKNRRGEFIVRKPKVQ
jgi:peptidoglycan-associated lipoprotein